MISELEKGVLSHIIIVTSLKWQNMIIQLYIIKGILNILHSSNKETDTIWDKS